MPYASLVLLKANFIGTLRLGHNTPSPSVKVESFYNVTIRIVLSSQYYKNLWNEKFTQTDAIYWEYNDAN